MGHKNVEREEAEAWDEKGLLGRKVRLHWLVKALSPLDDILTQAPLRPQGSPLALQGLMSGAPAGTWSQLLNHTFVLEDAECDAWRESCLWQAWTPAWLKEHSFLYVASLIHT